MPGYLIGSVDTIDRERMARYAQESAPIVERFGGRRVAVGPAETVEGDWPWVTAFLYEFPTRSDALAFWNSPEYQSMIAFRQGAAISQSAIFGD